MWDKHNYHAPEWTRESHEDMKIARIKQSFKMYTNSFPIPIFLKGGERYLMSDFVMYKLREITHPTNIKEEIGKWSFKNIYRPYPGGDLTGKTIVSWRTGGIGDFCWIAAAVKAIKRKYSDFHFIMGCSPQYRPLTNACSSFDETYSMPMNAKLMKRGDWHVTYENAVENNPRAEMVNCYKLISERLQLSDDDYPIELRRPPLVPQPEALEKLRQFWKAIDLDPAAMKIGIQVKTSSPIRTPDFSYMVSLIKVLKERWPNAYIFVFDSPANVKRVQDAVEYLGMPRVINWLRFFQDLSITIALVKELDLTIAPDSSINHISGSFSIPNVGIMGPFSPFSRLITYPYSSWVTPDFSRWNCMPCWEHSDTSCRIGQQNGIYDHSICLDSIKIYDILKEVDFVIDLKKRGVPRWKERPNTTPRLDGKFDSRF